MIDKVCYTVSRNYRVTGLSPSAFCTRPREKDRDDVGTRAYARKLRESVRMR